MPNIVETNKFLKDRGLPLVIKQEAKFYIKYQDIYGNQKSIPGLELNSLPQVYQPIPNDYLIVTTGGEKQGDFTAYLINPYTFDIVGDLRNGASDIRINEKQKKILAKPVGLNTYISVGISARAEVCNWPWIEKLPTLREFTNNAPDMDATVADIPPAQSKTVKKADPVTEQKNESPLFSDKTSVGKYALMFRDKDGVVKKVPKIGLSTTAYEMLLLMPNTKRAIVKKRLDKNNSKVYIVKYSTGQITEEAKFGTNEVEYDPKTEELYFAPFNIAGDRAKSIWKIEPGKGTIGTVINYPANLPKISAYTKTDKTVILESGKEKFVDLITLPASFIKEPQKRGRKPGGTVKKAGTPGKRGRPPKKKPTEQTGNHVVIKRQFQNLIGTVCSVHINGIKVLNKETMIGLHGGNSFAFHTIFGGSVLVLSVAQEHSNKPKLILFGPDGKPYKPHNKAHIAAINLNQKNDRAQLELSNSTKMYINKREMIQEFGKQTYKIEVK